MPQRSWNLLQLHVAVLLFGLAGLLGKLLNFSPVVIVFGRVALASLVLIGVSWFRSLPFWPRSWRNLLVFAALGVLLALHWTAFFQSVQVSTVAIALITYSTFPIFVALLGPLLFREKFRILDLLLAFLTLAGIVILVPRYDLENDTTQGILWGVAAGLTFALLSLLNLRLVQRHSSITIALYQDAFAALALLPLVPERWPTFTVVDVLLLLALGVLCTAVAHSLFIAGMHGIRAQTASTVACLEPVYGILLAALLLDEIPSLRTVVGGLVILAVAFYATLRARSEGAVSSNKPA